MVIRRARSTVRSLSRSLTRPARYGSDSHRLHLSSKRGPPPLLQRVAERKRRKRPSVLPQGPEGRVASHSCATTKRFDARHIEPLAGDPLKRPADQAESLIAVRSKRILTGAAA